MLVSVLVVTTCHVNVHATPVAVTLSDRLSLSDSPHQLCEYPLCMDPTVTCQSFGLRLQDPERQQVLDLLHGA